MAKHKILDKNSKIEDGQVVVVQTTEEYLTLQDLYQVKQNLNHQKQGIIQQMMQLKERLTLIENQEIEHDGYIKTLESQM